MTSNASPSPTANPLVTIIVLCYNQTRFVVETLESVKAQTYTITELVIVDDCSSDDSVAVIDRWLRENKIPCNFIRHQKNQGICKSLNEALAATSGKYVSTIAADDIWLPDKIERQVALMESQPESVGVLYSDAFQIDESGRPLSGMYIGTHWKLSEMPRGQVLDTLLKFNFVPGLTALIRRRCYDTVGLYDEGLAWEDWDMWLRIAREYSFAYSPIPSAKYRVHNNSLSRDALAMAIGKMKILSKQSELGRLNEAQSAALAASLKIHRRPIPRAHFEMATAALQKGDRAGTMKHLANCVRSSRFRLPGRVIDWMALTVYLLFGLRHVRWWKHKGAESTSEIQKLDTSA